MSLARVNTINHTLVFPRCRSLLPVSFSVQDIGWLRNTSCHILVYRVKKGGARGTAVTQEGVLFPNSETLLHNYLSLSTLIVSPLENTFYQREVNLPALRWGAAGHRSASGRRARSLASQISRSGRRVSSGSNWRDASQGLEELRTESGICRRRGSESNGRRNWSASGGNKRAGELTVLETAEKGSRVLVVGCPLRICSRLRLPIEVIFLAETDATAVSACQWQRSLLSLGDEVIQLFVAIFFGCMHLSRASLRSRASKPRRYQRPERTETCCAFTCDDKPVRAVPRGSARASGCHWSGLHFGVCCGQRGRGSQRPTCCWDTGRSLERMDCIQLHVQGVVQYRRTWACHSVVSVSSSPVGAALLAPACYLLLQGPGRSVMSRPAGLVANKGHGVWSADEYSRQAEALCALLRLSFFALNGCHCGGEERSVRRSE